MFGSTASCGGYVKKHGDGGHTTADMTSTVLWTYWNCDFWDEMMEVFHILMFDYWFIWLHWCLCCLTVAKFKPNILKPATVPVFWDWKWRECPVSLTEIRALATLRECAQTDTVNHPSIHWLTPLGTHTQCQHQSSCRENYVGLPVLSQSIRWHHSYLRTLVLVSGPGGDIPLQFSSTLLV